MKADATNKPESSNTRRRSKSSDSKSERRWYVRSNADNCDDVCDVATPQSPIDADGASEVDVQDCDDDSDDPTPKSSPRDDVNENERASDTTPGQADRDYSPEYDPFASENERASDTTPDQDDSPDPFDDSTYSRVENRGRPFSRVPLWHVLLKHSGPF